MIKITFFFFFSFSFFVVVIVVRGRFKVGAIGAPTLTENLN